MFHVVVDSAADVPATLRDEYNIGVVPIPISAAGRVYDDGVDMTREAFYALLMQTTALPQTAAPPPGAYATFFARLAEDGLPILSISIAGQLSGTYAAARLGARLAEDEGARVACFDSATISMPIAFLAAEAARAAKAGASLAEGLELLEGLREKTVLYFGLDTLEYLRRGGRIGRAKALLGGVLNVKPILTVGANTLEPVAQVRTTRRIAPLLAELTQARGAYRALGVLYTTDRVAAEALAERCATAGLMPREQILLEQVTAGLGVHAGPGAIGVAGLLV